MHSQQPALKPKKTSDLLHTQAAKKKPLRETRRSSHQKHTLPNRTRRLMIGSATGSTSVQANNSEQNLAPDVPTLLAVRVSNPAVQDCINSELREDTPAQRSNSSAETEVNPNRLLMLSNDQEKVFYITKHMGVKQMRAYMRAGQVHKKNKQLHIGADLEPRLTDMEIDNGATCLPQNTRIQLPARPRGRPKKVVDSAILLQRLDVQQNPHLDFHIGADIQPRLTDMERDNGVRPSLKSTRIQIPARARGRPKKVLDPAIILQQHNVQQSSRSDLMKDPLVKKGCETIRTFQKRLKLDGHPTTRPQELDIKNSPQRHSIKDGHHKIFGEETSRTSKKGKCRKIRTPSSPIVQLNPPNSDHAFQLPLAPIPAIEAKTASVEAISEAKLGLQPSFATAMVIRNEGGIAASKHINKVRGGTARDGKRKNRAVMDILGLGAGSVPKVQRVFVRRKTLELSIVLGGNSNLDRTVSFPLACRRVGSVSEGNIMISRRSTVVEPPAKRGRGRPRKLPLNEVKLIENVETGKVSEETPVKLYLDPRPVATLHGKRTQRKGVTGPRSSGCARCSIQGWSWRRWALNGAKWRLRKASQGTGHSSALWRSFVSSATSLHSARTNRATLRKLFSAAEGSDNVKFNQLKVRVRHFMTNFVKFQV